MRQRGADLRNLLSNLSFRLFCSSVLGARHVQSHRPAFRPDPSALRPAALLRCRGRRATAGALHPGHTRVHRDHGGAPGEREHPHDLPELSGRDQHEDQTKSILKGVSVWRVALSDRL